jgi:predicted lipid carrier protein YhbT
MSFPAPAFCRILTRPLRWLPQRAHAGGLSLALNRLLAQPLADGDLDFLRDKVVGLEVSDLGIRFRLARDGRGFVPAADDAPEDVRFSGDVRTLLQLATQREDADTLFFQRRLKIEGDTETGLHLKNFLDAFGEPPLPAALRDGLARFADLYARHCGSAAEVQARQPSPGRPVQ